MGRGTGSVHLQAAARPPPAPWSTGHGRMTGVTDTDVAPVRLAPGDTAPEFTLPDADGNPVSLADHRGRRAIAYCYPAATTPGRTTQAVDFTASAGELAAAGRGTTGI